MLNNLALAFLGLVAAPFRDISMIWGVVPVYVAWLMSETTPQRRSYRTALQTGFSFVWSAAQWYWRFEGHARGRPPGVVSLVFTALFALFGLLALWSGIRRRFPKRMAFLGHARFGNYLLVAVYPMMAGALPWTFLRAAAVAVFAPVVWAAVHFLLLPFRK
jgi:hypothetical protein